VFDEHQHKALATIAADSRAASPLPYKNYDELYLALSNRVTALD